MIVKTFLNPATNKQWRIEIDGHTIRTCLNGGKVKEMCREIQWKCQYEDALIQPPRGVLDINMGKYASGGR